MTPGAPMAADRSNPVAAAIARAQVLLDQHRADLAEIELRRALREDPEEPELHAMLAIALSGRKRFAAAIAEAETASGLAPDSAWVHAARGQVLLDSRRPEAAAAALGEALRLDAANPAYVRLLGFARLTQRRWKEALGLFDNSLAVAPDTGALAGRAIAAAHLGRGDEARRDAELVLQADPGSSNAFAVRGYLALHAGRADDSIAAFREALRLDPTNDFAEGWILEALRGRRGISRLVQRYQLWTTRAGRAKTWSARGAIGVLGRVPGVGAVVSLFILWSWIATPIVQLNLLRDPFGRLLLRRADIAQGLAVAGLLVLTVAALVLEGATGSGRWALIGGASLALAVPTAQVLRMQPGWPRRVMLGWAGGCALAAAATAILAAAVDQPISWNRFSSNTSAAIVPFQLEVFAVIVLLFVANRLANVEPGL